METATIVPEPGQLKNVLRRLNELSGGHADATVDGAYEITVPSWLAEVYNGIPATAVEPKPVRRTRRPRKKEVEQ